MLRSVLLASVLASLASAQTSPSDYAPIGYGRFPCTTTDNYGYFHANQAACANDVLKAPGLNQADTGYQGDGPTPVDSQCVEAKGVQLYQLGFYCGIAGAACTSNANCDNGYCDKTSGTCQGGFGQICNNSDNRCSGYLYCGTDNTCGGIGAYCEDYAANPATFSQFCRTRTCDSVTGFCTYIPDYSPCVDVEPSVCAPGSYCDTFICGRFPILPCACAPGPEPSPIPDPDLGASQRARARRDFYPRRNLCTANKEACSMPGSKGFECIDTTSNLEQCGACASAGGVDCTALPGVESVGCVAGTCEIWACTEGYQFSAASSTCELA